ncbi:hypothetical protein Tco_0081224, partial [Tanacetum coccineum]
SNVNIVRPIQPVPTSNSTSFSPVRPHVNKFNQRSNFSKSHSPVRRPIVRNTAKKPYSHAVKGNWGTSVKTSAGYNWRNTRPNSNCNSGSNFVQTVNAKGPQGRPKPEKAWGKPNLGLWYPRESPFDLEAYSDSDYAGANLDRKSTTGGCQFLGRRLISWQCKKQTIMSTSTTKVEYVAAASCCGFKIKCWTMVSIS